MRKIFVFFMALVGLGMMLGGCVSDWHGITKVPAKYVINNYINTKKPNNKEKVGNPNIYFSVDKVIDKRKDKMFFRKDTSFGLIYLGKVVMKSEKDFREATIKTIYKALSNTNWGVSYNKKNANYIIDIDITEMHTNKWIGAEVLNADISIYQKNMKLVIKHHLHRELAGIITFARPILHGSLKQTAGWFFDDLYYTLVKFFSSPEFVNVVEHKSVVFDNSSNSKPLSN